MIVVASDFNFHYSISSAHFLLRPFAKNYLRLKYTLQILNLSCWL